MVPETVKIQNMLFSVLHETVIDVYNIGGHMYVQFTLL